MLCLIVIMIFIPRQNANAEIILDENDDTLTISWDGKGKSNFNYSDMTMKYVKKVVIKEGITGIGESAFSGFDKMLSVEIPSSVTSIGNYAFDSSGLVNITIPENVIEIGWFAFENCNDLTNITIHKRLNSIGNKAFYDCNNLENVYYTGTQDEWNKINIGDDNFCLTSAIMHYNYLIPCLENKHNNFGEWSVVTNQTCTASGLKQRICRYDGYVETAQIPATGHSFGNNLPNCLVCGAANPDYVAPTPTPIPTPTLTQPTQTSKPVSKPKSAKFKKVKAAKKAVSVEWKKVSGVKGYQVQVATDKKFKKNKKTATVKKQKTTKVTIKKLKAKKKYYVRIRTYKTVKGKKIYSSWSKVKKVKTK